MRVHMNTGSVVVVRLTKERIYVQRFRRSTALLVSANWKINLCCCRETNDMKFGEMFFKDGNTCGLYFVIR